MRRRRSAKNRWLLKPAFAAFGDRPIGEVTAPELLHALRKFELRGRYESARRMRTVAGMIFRYAIATGRATRDIALDLRGALTTPKVKHRAAITEPKELGALLRAIEGYDGQPTTRLALQLSALLFLRPGELRLARWREVDFGEAVWAVPAETMKMKRPHRVPLPRQAIVIFRALQGMTGQGEYVFPAVNSFRRPISNNTLNAALRRLGYSKEEVSVSGFRTTASTLLNQMSRWNPDAIERQLAHMEENEVRWAYMHAAEFWNERVEMMQVWADYLDQLRYGRQWMHRYDHSRTLTAENSPLKAETGVRFPLGSANNFNRLDQFSDLLSQPFFNFSPTVFHYGGLGNSIHGCQRGCLPFFGEPVDP